VQVIGLNGRTEIGIDQIKDMQRFSSLKPGDGKHWVFIIDGAEQLSREASNRLLKTLEEPPPDVQLVLLAINESLVLPTVLSRCQRLKLRPLATAIVEQALTHRWGVPPDQARTLARLSRGCLGWAVAASSDKGLLDERGQRLSTLRHLALASREESFAYVAQLARQFSKDRASVREVLQLWLDWWRDLMLVREGCGRFATNVDQEATIHCEAQSYSLTQIKDFIRSLQQAMEQLDQNANPRLVLEFLMLSIPRGKEDRDKTLSRI
jgi:DNA polymerase-3 subunit delta'